MLSLAFLLHCCLSSGVGVLMLFFPDDLRDYFCEPTVRKCEKLSGCGTNECMRARHRVCLCARHHTCMSLSAGLAQSLSGIVGVFLVAQAFLSHTAKTLRDPNARRGIAWALAMQHAMLVCESRRVALLLINK